jgi:glycine/D-amino acid oxidase-like deaminating enzyme
MCPVEGHGSTAAWFRGHFACCTADLRNPVPPSVQPLWYNVLLACVAAGVELQAAEPALSPQLARSCQHAKLYAQEGWCDPAAATAAFLADAQTSGATVMYNQQVIRCWL